MNYLSLFAGIGGMDLGLERAGMTCVGQVEIDPFCQRVLARHWPEVPRHDDVRTAVDWWLGSPRPAVDVVCGGFPCQPVSLAGRGLAQADERWLWPAAWAVIRDLRPAFAILENVPGLLGRGLGDVLGDLAEIGYDAEWDCVPAAAVGAPHRRDRVFVVAYPQRDAVREQPEPEPWRGGAAIAGHDGSDGHVADTKGDGRRTRRTRRPSSGSANGSSLPQTRLADADSEPLVWAPVARTERDPWATEPDVDRVAHGISGRVDRLRALGNAVVPQVAEHVGRLVMAGAA